MSPASTGSYSRWRDARDELRPDLPGGLADPVPEGLRFPDVQPLAEREDALPQGLTHSCGKSTDMPDFGAHRSQIPASSQGCRHYDEIMVVT